MNQFSKNPDGSFQLPDCRWQNDVPEAETDPFYVIDVSSGQFVAKDPYVSDNEVEIPPARNLTETPASPCTNQSKPMTTPPTSPNNQPLVNDDPSNRARMDSTESELDENPTGEEAGTKTVNDHDVTIPPARTLESILDSIPGYQDDQDVEVAPSNVRKEDLVDQAKSKSLAEEVAEKLSRDPRFNFPLTEAPPIPIIESSEEPAQSTVAIETPMLDAAEMHSPVADTESATEGEVFPPVSWFAIETTQPPNNQTPVPFLDMSVPATIADLVSGEEVFDIKDFLDEVTAPIPPIFGAFQDTTIVSLALGGDAESLIAQEPADKPVSDGSLSDGSLSEELLTDGTHAKQEDDPESHPNPLEEPSEPVSETELALAACTEVSSPMDDKDPNMSKPVLVEPSKSDEGVNDNLFIADEGDVIQIDGNDGYEFIDLACFHVDMAKIEPGKIVIVDESCSAFEIYYKNIQYALFSDDMRVDLPPSG